MNPEFLQQHPSKSGQRALLVGDPERIARPGSRLHALA